MNNIVFSTRNIDDFISDIANEVVKKIELWQIKQQPTPSHPDERLSRKQLSKEKNISLGTIHNLMKKGELPYEKIGRKTLFRRGDVEQYFLNKKGGKI